MGTKLRVAKLQNAKILKHNKNIDAAIVSAHRKLERELRFLKVEIKPEFKVVPPLGRGTARLNSQDFQVPVQDVFCATVPALLADRSIVGANWIRSRWTTVGGNGYSESRSLH